MSSQIDKEKNNNLPSIEELPVIDGFAVKSIDCGEDTRMLCAEGAGADAYAEYCASVCNVGFKKISSRKEVKVQLSDPSEVENLMGAEAYKAAIGE